MIVENLYTNNCVDYRKTWQAIMEFLVKAGLKNWSNLIIDYEEMYNNKPTYCEILLAVDVRSGFSYYEINPNKDSYEPRFKSYSYIFRIIFSNGVTVDRVTSLENLFDSADHRREVAERFKSKYKNNTITYGELEQKGLLIKEFNNFVAGKEIPFSKLEVLARMAGVTPEWLLFGDK